MQYVQAAQVSPFGKPIQHFFMATTKIKFRASSVSGKQGTLFIQVIHKRVVRQASTSYRIHPSEWDPSTQSVLLPADFRSDRCRYLYSVQQALQKDMSRLQLIILSLDHTRRDYRAEDVIRRFLMKESSDDFMSFAEKLLREKLAEGHRSLVVKYQTSLRSFDRFLDGRHLTLEEMDVALMSSYEKYLKQRGLCPNTTSFYMRNLRSIYNQAVINGLTHQRNPFARVYTGVAKTVKRAIQADDVQKIRTIPLPAGSAAALSRDLFLFSLYTCGMSLIDIAHLKKTDIQGRYLSYNRQKTGQLIRIRWEPCMQQLVDKYAIPESPYLFPIIARPGVEEMRQYQNMIHLVNHHLKKLGKQLELSSKLTSYVARHSWASIAMSRHVPVAAISEAMGHTSERTTRIYLKLFENTIIDCANQKVLSVLE